METQVKEKKKNSKKINIPQKDKLESIINDDIKSIDNSNYFSKFLIEIIKDFVKKTEEYNNKLQILLTKLSSEELSKRKIVENNEIKISNLFKDIIKLIINKINKMLKSLSDTISYNSKETEKKIKIEVILNNKKHEFFEKYLKQISDTEMLNKKFLKEYSNYEDYLIYKNASSIDKSNENNKKDKNEFEQLDYINDNNNIKITKDIQDKLINYINDSNNNIKENLQYFSNEKILNQEKIFTYLNIFFNTILKGFFKENNFTNDINSLNKSLEEMNESRIKEINNLKINEDLLFKIESYSLKCLNIEKQNLDLKMNEVRLLKQLNYKKIYNIMKEIKDNQLIINKKDMGKYEEIEKKVYIGQYIDKLFDNNFGEIKEENGKKNINEKENQEPQIIKEYFKLGEIYRTEFLIYLNNIRAGGKLDLNKKSSEILGDLLLNLNEYVLKEKNFHLFKMISLLSMTYFYYENDKKIYLCHYINNCQEFNKKQFWIDYLKALISKELKNNKDLEKPILDYGYNEVKNIKSKKIHITIYSNIFSLSKIMKDFGLKKDFILEWLNIVVDNILYIDDSQRKDIIGIINE